MVGGDGGVKPHPTLAGTSGAAGVSGGEQDVVVAGGGGGGCVRSRIVRFTKPDPARN